MRYFAIAVALLMCAASAQAYIGVAVKDGPIDEPGQVVVVSDGAPIDIGSTLSDTNHESYYLAAQYDGNGDPNLVSLLGWKDMFTALPDLTSSAQIVSATLRLCQRGPNGDEVFDICRVTSQWLVQTPGDNESTITGVRRLPGGENPFWAAGEAAGFGSGDYTTTNKATLTLTEYNYNKPVFTDVTAIVKDMMNESGGNQGFVIIQTAGSWDPWFQGDEQTQMGDDGYYAKPTLYITYVPEPATMALLAIGGIGVLLRRKR